MEDRKVKIEISEQEFQVLNDVLLNLEIPVSKGFVIGNILQRIYVAFRKEVDKNGKTKD